MARQRVALVTGCSKGGIGHALCIALAAKGCIVYATGRKLGLLEGLEQLGCRLHELDVTRAAAIARVVDLVIAEQGRIDLLVNNAGAMLKGWAVETELADVRRLMEVNYFAVLAMTQAVAPHMIAQRSGTIANISSSCAWVSVAQASAYCASKFAVRAYSDALRAELAPFGVHVMHVAPGFIRTQLFRSDTSVAPRRDSAYSHFQLATNVLQSNDLEAGPGAWGATDPHDFCRRLSAAMLRSRPPRNYCDGFLSWVLYYLGCFAPAWLTDALNRLRLGLVSAPRAQQAAAAAE